MLVGVAVPTYRSEHLLAATLESLLAQSHSNWRCVVVNDGQEDGSGKVVARLGDARIRYVCDGEHRGQFGNFNRAILEVLKEDVDVVRLLCGDDVLYPSDLADMIRIFGSYPRVGLVATHYDGIDGDNRILFRAVMNDRDDLIMPGRDYLLKGVAVGNTIGGPSSVALRRAAIETAGLFDTRINHSGEADLWHRVAAHWDVAWVGRRANLKYRFHGGSITQRERHSWARYSDQFQLVRRVAATEPLFGGRWWVHQYTIGRLHSLNVGLLLAFLRRRDWHGARTVWSASWREGVLWYAPLWLPRLPWQVVQRLLGRDPSRRLLLRRIHERLQPPRAKATSAAQASVDNPVSVSEP